METGTLRHLQSTPMPRGEDNLPPTVVTETLQPPPLRPSNERQVAATMSRPRPFRLLVTNAFSLCSKIGNLQHALITHNVDIAVVTETKMTIDKVTQAEATIPGYAPPIRRDRTAHGGGVAIWVKAGVPHKELDIDPATQEIIWIRIAANHNTRLGLCAAYRPGSCAHNDISMFDQIDAGIETARQSCSNVILAGDFNVHNEDWLGSSHTTIAGETAEGMCYQQHLQQHVNDATRRHNILDRVMSDIPNHVTTLLHLPLGRSDHAVITADFQLTPSHDQPSTRTVWRYQHAAWPRFRAFFRKMDWDTILPDNPDSASELIAPKIIDGMNKFIPSKVMRTRPTDPIWWTPECSAAVEAKRKAWNLHRRNRDNIVLQEAYTYSYRKLSDQKASASHATNTEEAAFRKHARHGVVVYSKACWWPWQAIHNSCPR